MKRYGPRIRNSPIVQHLKHAVRTVVRTYPVLEPSARRLYLLFWRQKVRFRAAVKMRGIVDPNRTLQVDPNAIQDVFRVWDWGVPQKVADRGNVIDGDWDRRRRSFAESDVYRAMVDRFTRSRAWEETDYYRVYPGFPTIFRGLSEFFVGDLMGKALWKLVENAQRFPRRGGRVLCVHGPVSFHRARPCATKWPPRRGLRTGPPASSDCGRP